MFSYQIWIDALDTKLVRSGVNSRLQNPSATASRIFVNIGRTLDTTTLPRQSFPKSFQKKGTLTGASAGSFKTHYLSGVWIVT
jgi:hypothetical protein